MGRDQQSDVTDYITHISIGQEPKNTALIINFQNTCMLNTSAFLGEDDITPKTQGQQSNGFHAF